MLRELRLQNSRALDTLDGKQLLYDAKSAEDYLDIDERDILKKAVAIFSKKPKTYTDL